MQASGAPPGEARLDHTATDDHRKAACAATRGDLAPSETIVRLLAARVAALAPEAG
ncbi:hypothetical protein [Methylobacterium frigidaeris]|uniref:hypothetical protein n=1 Tax=Methylobacterium frigidaeris TaxID=2038277 RepID=UPI003F68A842